MKLFLSSFLLIASLNVFAATPVVVCTASGTVDNQHSVQDDLALPMFGKVSSHTMDFYGHTAIITHQPEGVNEGKLNVVLKKGEATVFGSNFKIREPLKFQQGGLFFMIYCDVQMKH